MKSKTTWSCVAIAGILFAFIFYVEHPFREQSVLSQSTKIFPAFDAKAATHIELVRGGNGKIRVERTNDSWLLTSPLVYPAAKATVEKFLQTLAELSWQAHISAGELKNRPKAQEEFGFAAPVARLLVQQGDAPLNLLVGTNTPVGDQVYLQVVGDVGVYVVDNSFLKFLPQTANDWRDPAVFGTTAPINSIKARSGNKSFTLTHTNGLWRMPQARADTLKVDELLHKTLALRVAKFETDDPKADLESFGLQTPEMELTFASGTNILATLQVGKSPTNDPAHVFARLQNQNNIYRVDLEPLGEWRSSYTNFVDRGLVNLSSNTVEQIEVRGEDRFVLKRNGAGWVIAGVTNFTVDVGLVSDVLNLLSRVEVDIEKEVVTDFVSYGLEPPALEYTLRNTRTSTNSALAQIQFGTNQPGKIFVRRLDEFPETVKTIHPEQFARLPQTSWQFRDRQVWNFTATDVVSVAVHQKGKERKLIRNERGDWAFAPGSQGILNPFSFDEALFRLGRLKAVFWVARDEKNSGRFGFKEAAHQIAIEVKRGGKTEVLSLEFGGFSEFGTRYAATVLDGARLVFEFPWPLFFEVQDSLTIP